MPPPSSHEQHVPVQRESHEATGRIRSLAGRLLVGLGLRRARLPLTPEHLEETDLFAARIRLSAVIANPVACAALREHLQAQRGGEYLEFLLAYWNFDRSRNALQRFEQVSHIIHRFVRSNADRSIQLSERCRVQLLREWEWWSEHARLPVDSRLPALEAAAHEVYHLASSTSFAPWLYEGRGPA